MGVSFPVHLLSLPAAVPALVALAAMLRPAEIVGAGGSGH